LKSSVSFTEDTSSRVKIQPSIRVQNNILAKPERVVLNSLCSQMPSAVTPDALTAIGVVGAGIVFVGYVGSRFNPAFFWLAIVGFLVNWFGDSLDGSLARFRGVEKQRYGYFLDHSADALSILLILLGLGFSPYVRLDVALLVLVSYFLMCIYVFLYNHVSGSFQISFASLGPTELRIGLILLNLWMYVDGPSKIAIFGKIFSVYDLAIGVVAASLVGLFLVSTSRAVRRLRFEEGLTGRNEQREEATTWPREPWRNKRRAVPLAVVKGVATNATSLTK
jgi:archaetidylinositol phosphate synthase